jgi:hypothetical protein
MSAVTHWCVPFSFSSKFCEFYGIWRLHFLLLQRDSCWIHKLWQGKKVNEEIYIKVILKYTEDVKLSILILKLNYQSFIFNWKYWAWQIYSDESLIIAFWKTYGYSGTHKNKEEPWNTHSVTILLIYITFHLFCLSHFSLLISSGVGLWWWSRR